MNSSTYINKQRRDYSLYVLQMRAIPSITDGLKAGGRRVLWTARDGKKYKSATLAGATMPIHPHAMPEGAINTLAAPYGNNIPLLNGDCAFGTLLNPTAYGAGRYTSAKVSHFTKDVMFRDIEIVPMQENYDGTLQEPKHFLPLVPISLLNPSEGIAVGFASTILPRSLENIINAQIKHLQGKKFPEAFPYFVPTDSEALEGYEEGKSVKWMFEGTYKKVDASTVKITKFPYGLTHTKVINHLLNLEEDGKIINFIDMSQSIINIEVKFKRGGVDKMSRSEMKKLLKLTNTVSENMTVLDFDGKSVWLTNYNDTIKKFCDWRLVYYINRYERLKELVEKDIQKYKDIITAIKKNVGGTAKKIGSRSELKEFLEAIDIVHIDYIADLPVYRFTEEERKKVENKLKAANITLKNYKKLLSSEPERRIIYINELKEVLKNYTKGLYDER